MRLIALILAFRFAAAAAAPAEHADRAYAWLAAQASAETGLVPGYAGGTTCWLYDQALAVIAFTARNSPGGAEKARRILRTLGASRQNGTQAPVPFVFACDVRGTASTPAVTTGSNAWLALAIAHYERQTGDKQFRPVAEAILDWMTASCTARVDGKLGVVMSDRDAPHTAHDERTILSTEHNLDAAAAFQALGELTGDEERLETAADIREFLTAVLWNGSRFRGGCRRAGELDETVYTDAQAWGVLVLGSAYASALDAATERCRVVDKTHAAGDLAVHGLAGYTEHPGTGHLWFEGTESMVAALTVTGARNQAEFYHGETLRAAHGVSHPGADAALGIPYATPDAKEASSLPSVAATAWFCFNEWALNPFRLADDDAQP